MSVTPLSQSVLNGLGDNRRDTHLHSGVEVASENGRSHKLAGLASACIVEAFHVRLPFLHVFDDCNLSKRASGHEAN